MQNLYNSKNNTLSQYAGGFINGKLWYNPVVLMAIWALVTACAAGLKCAGGANDYNNYVIFYHSALHLADQLPLYSTYPDLYHDQFLYGPLFALLIAPFAALAPAVGMIMWVVAISSALYLAIRTLPLNNQAQAVIVWICLNELFTALAMQQFNVVVAGLIIGTFVMFEREKYGWAALMVVAGTMIKIYGIVGLAFFIFAGHKRKFILYCLLWGVVLFVAPMLFSSPEYVLNQYEAWLTTITHKNELNSFAMLQNLSLLGIVRKVSGSTAYTDLWLIVPGLVLFAAVYLRTKQYKNLNFRLMLLASVLIFIVIFSSGSENSSHVIAALGVGIWCVASPCRWGWLRWSLVGLFIFMSFSRSLLGHDLDVNTVVKYSLKALPMSLIWFRICYEMYFMDFTPREYDNVSST